MPLPQSVRHFLDTRQWKASEFEVHKAASSKEFTDEILLKDYAVPVYVVRNWAVAHFTDRIVYVDLKDYTYDGVVSLDNEEKYLTCGLFQEPVSLMHRYIKSGKTITLSFSYELKDPSMLNRKSVKHKELDNSVKFLVEVTKRRCRIFAFLKR